MFVDTLFQVRWILRTVLKLTLSTLLMAVIASGRLDAAELPAMRACMPADLSGSFSLIDYREIPTGKVISGGPFTMKVSEFPYDLLQFYPDGSWATMAFNQPPISLRYARNALQSQRQKAGYTLQPDGQIVLHGSGRPAFVGHCLVSLSTTGGFLPNDLILSGFDADNRDEQHRLYRAWTGEQIARAASTFDPAPAAGTPAGAAAAAGPSVPVQASLPKEPVPVQLQLKSDGPDGAIWLYATNAHSAPLSAFVIGERDASTSGKWQTIFVDACLGHHSAWQPGAAWTQRLGIRIAVGKVDFQLGAALFADGSTWGDESHLTELKAHRGNCQWPGS